MTYKKIVNEIYARKLKTGWVLPILKGKVPPEDEVDFMIDLASKIICDKAGDDLDFDDVCFEDEFPKIKDYILSLLNKMNKKKR